MPGPVLGSQGYGRGLWTTFPSSQWAERIIQAGISSGGIRYLCGAVLVSSRQMFDLTQQPSNSLRAMWAVWAVVQRTKNHHIP